MNNLLLLLPLILCLEILTRINFKKRIVNSINILVKIKKTLKYINASDKHKEKAIIKLSFKFFYHNSLILLNLFLIFSPFIIVIIIDKIYDLSLINSFYDIYFYLLSIIVTFIYLKLKSFFYAK